MAQKSKGFGELLYQQKALNRTQQEIERGELGGITGVVMSPKGVAKMSDVLEEFIDPYLDAVETRNQHEKLFSIAIVAWNLAIMPKADRQPLMQQLIDQAAGNDQLARHDTQEILDQMIARKERFFADNKRYILNFQLQGRGNNLHLTVTSTLDQPDNPI